MQNFQLSILLTVFLPILAMAGNDTIQKEYRSSSKISSETSSRDKKILNMFTTVRFKNVGCAGANGLNGTCYTSVECSSKGGTAAGTCAASFGVCCTFSLGCGSTSSQNCTYFVSNTAAAGTCQLTICPCNSNICQLRLDFSNFVITGPSTSTLSDVKLKNGVVVASGSKLANTASECLTDTFTVTGSTGCTTPTICGTNTGQHMYVESNKNCNNLVFNLGSVGIFATIPTTRTWTIKVTQYACDYTNLAPTCCTQYFYGATTGALSSYNYQSGAGVQIADQTSNICVRRERNICQICWTTTKNTDFMVSGSKVMNYMNSACCSNGPAANVINGYNCVIIPGASTVNGIKLSGSRYCGKSAGLGTVKGGAAVAKTICTTQTPFNLVYNTAQYTYLADTKPVGAGFKLTYIEVPCAAIAG